MTFVYCQSTSVANWSFTNVAKELQLIFPLMFHLAKCWALQNILIVFVFKVCKRQKTVLSVSSDYVVRGNVVVTPKETALETIATLKTSFVAISTFDPYCTALFKGQHI